MLIIHNAQELTEEVVGELNKIKDSLGKIITYTTYRSACKQDLIFDGIRACLFDISKAVANLLDNHNLPLDLNHYFMLNDLACLEMLFVESVSKKDTLKTVNSFINNTLPEAYKNYKTIS